MSLTIDLSPDAEALLSARASSVGQDLNTYVSRLVDRMATASKTLEELSGPIYQNFLDSGMTDDELGDLLEDAKHDMRAERRKKAAGHG
jgi:hypothetical protein